MNHLKSLKDRLPSRDSSSSSSTSTTSTSSSNTLTGLGLRTKASSFVSSKIGSGSSASSTNTTTARPLTALRDPREFAPPPPTRRRPTTAHGGGRYNHQLKPETERSEDTGNPNRELLASSSSPDLALAAAVAGKKRPPPPPPKRLHSYTGGGGGGYGSAQIPPSPARAPTVPTSTASTAPPPLPPRLPPRPQALLTSGSGSGSVEGDAYRTAMAIGSGAMRRGARAGEEQQSPTTPRRAPVPPPASDTARTLDAAKTLAARDPKAPVGVGDVKAAFVVAKDAEKRFPGMGGKLVRVGMEGGVGGKKPVVGGRGW